MNIGDLMATLNIEWQALIVNIVGFVLLYVLLRKIYYGPVGKFLTEREQGIRESLDDAERAFLVSLLEKNAWNRAATARELGVHKTTLWRKMKRLGIEAPSAA